MNVKNGSAGFPAQVCTVTDTDGTIHPVWVKYQDPEDGLVAIKINEVKKQSPDYMKSVKSFLCTGVMHKRLLLFCLCYSYSSRRWTIEFRTDPEEYNRIINNFQ